MSVTSVATKLSIRKRDGRVKPFEVSRIAGAIAAAMEAEFRAARQEPDGSLQELAERLAADVVTEAEFEAARTDGLIDVERVQDLVETQLMQAGEFRIARRYIVYREERSRARALRLEEGLSDHPSVSMRARDGDSRPIDHHDLKQRLYRACQGLAECSAADLLGDVVASVYDGITEMELERALVMVARQRIERDPAYSQVATRLLLDINYREAWGQTPATEEAGLP
ncbi:MAG: ATP cone domain-containing protein, partial [Bacteroidota bacterium]